MRRLTAVLGIVPVLLAPLARADESRIPIFQAITIAGPGHYIVTRDFAALVGVAIAIQANDVVLDLNGHTISGLAGQPAILVLGTSDNVIVRNGSIAGGTSGIESNTSQAESIRIESIHISGTSAEAIDIRFPAHADVVSCRIDGSGGDSGILLNRFNSALTFTGRFLDNTITAPDFNGMRLIGLQNSEVRRNLIVAPGVNGFGIRIDPTSVPNTEFGGNIIQDNQVFTATNSRSPGSGIFVTSSGNLVRNNVVMGGVGGITIGGDNNLLVENTCNRVGANGFLISGANNHLEGNQSNQNGGCGIQFLSFTTNIYRNNILRGDTGGAVCGVAATNGGGNIS